MTSSHRLRDFLRNQPPKAPRTNPTLHDALDPAALCFRVGAPSLERADEALDTLFDGSGASPQERWERCHTRGLIPDHWLDPATWRTWFRLENGMIYPIKLSDNRQDPPEVLATLAALGPETVQTAESLVRACYARLNEAPWRIARGEAGVEPTVQWLLAEMPLLGTASTSMRSRELTYEVLRGTLVQDTAANRRSELETVCRQVDRQVELAFQGAALRTERVVSARNTVLGERLRCALLLKKTPVASWPSFWPLDALRPALRSQVPDYLTPLLALYELGLVPSMIDVSTLQLLVPTQGMRTRMRTRGLTPSPEVAQGAWLPSWF